MAEIAPSLSYPNIPRLSMKQHKQKLYKHFSSAQYGCTIDRHASVN